ncbi:hypothetical protein MHYMCMPSP_00316 [Hyalomma marginatum]|uniref:Uncharacterized protein n=1 Tax=Hyalomma marginatum TaxID=34627 RepID=A0A8S4C424_9ACAR|nr:hypothetical protein MHYMCMPSP_00316 [Hyalomma marginatum]CAG7594252.1 hypothetical protein MHYMCMPASI_00745 [Hyalomma marginatum]
MDRAAQKWQDPHVGKGGLTEEQFLAKKLRSDEEKTM